MVKSDHLQIRIEIPQTTFYPSQRQSTTQKF